MKQTFLALIRNPLGGQLATRGAMASVHQTALSSSVRLIDRAELCLASGGVESTQSPYRGWSEVPADTAAQSPYRGW